MKKNFFKLNKKLSNDIYLIKDLQNINKKLKYKYIENQE